MMSGEWKGNEVAIRVANDNAITEEGLEFIEEAISAMKYALFNRHKSTSMFMAMHKPSADGGPYRCFHDEVHAQFSSKLVK